MARLGRELGGKVWVGKFGWVVEGVWRMGGRGWARLGCEHSGLWHTQGGWWVVGVGGEEGRGVDYNETVPRLYRGGNETLTRLKRG